MTSAETDPKEWGLGKPCAGKPPARFDEGESSAAGDRRTALSTLPFCKTIRMNESLCHEAFHPLDSSLHSPLTGVALETLTGAKFPNRFRRAPVDPAITP